MIRILHVVHGMDCGGTESMIMNLYRNIDRKAIQFDFLVHTEKECFFDKEIKKLGGNIYRVPYFDGINIREYTKALNLFFSSHAEFKIIHGHLGSCAAIYLRIAKKRGIYTIAHSHSAMPKNKKVRDYIYRIYSFPTRFIADYYFACSTAAGKDRFGKKIVKSNKFSVLHNAINTDVYLPDEQKAELIRNELNINNKFVIGHVGRFHYAKNHELIIEIFKHVSEIRGNSVLVLVGDGELRELIEQKIKDMKLQDKVILTGVRSDINDLLSVMDCFVFPSVYEGLGIAAVEAQCMGIPCFINELLPQELYINENVFGISLDKAAAEWAEIIAKKSNLRISAKTARKNVINAGYDVKETAKKLEEFYINF